MTTLKAEKRSMDVKAKRLRREGFVTGNVFGHAIEGSIPVKMNSVDAERLLKTEHKGGHCGVHHILRVSGGADSEERIPCFSVAVYPSQDSRNSAFCP